MESNKNRDPYSPENVQKKRKFPLFNTVCLVLCFVGQILLIAFAIWYQPTPQDRIEQYNVTVEPLPDGTLDITYELKWTALDETEPLTWIEVGMANEDFLICGEGRSNNISSIVKYTDDGYCSARIYLTRNYYGGDTLDIFFKVNQQRLLCRDNNGVLFYEFVPGWFNETPIENYHFKWKLDKSIVNNNAHYESNGFAIWEGSFECGEYELMKVHYSDSAFGDAETASYMPFDNDGTYNGLKEDKGTAICICIMLIIGLLVVEIIICDSYVSYYRGRGFIRGYGYHMHTYGYVNPRYRTARNAHNAARGGGGGGRGCACACACACAGGGRAGCSQKDTYGKRFRTKK